MSTLVVDFEVRSKMGKNTRSLGLLLVPCLPLIGRENDIEQSVGRASLPLILVCLLPDVTSPKNAETSKTR